MSLSDEAKPGADTRPSAQTSANGARRMPRVVIVVVSWNALPLLEKCLPSVMATDYPDFEVVLADNASTDGSADWVRRQYPRAHVVTHAKNWAFARGNNEAVRDARVQALSADYYVFLNNDVEVPANWLTPLVDRMEQERRLGALQPKLLRHDDRSAFEYAGAAGGFLDALGYPFTRGRVLFTMERDEGQYDAARTAFWATGAALMVRRAAWDPSRGFDEAFVMHMEEIDLCWRLQHRRAPGMPHWRVGVEPRSRVFHIGGASLPQGSPEKTFLNFRNNLLMLYKNLPPGRFLPGRFYWILAVRTPIDLLAAGRAALAGRWGEALAIPRAYLAAHRLKGRYREARPAADTAAPLPWRGTLVWHYMVRGRRTFAELIAKRRLEEGTPAKRHITE